MVVILCSKTRLLLLRWDMGKVRDRFGSIGRFKDGLRYKGWVNSVIINVITYRYLKIYKYNVKTCMYTIINLNVSS